MSVFDDTPCTCPWNRNDPFCPVHMDCGKHLWKEAPLFAQIAYDMDLNWAADKPSHLFWQHDRFSAWEMTT